MERRFVLFVALSILILIGNLWLQSVLHPAEKVPPGQQANEQAAEKPGPAGQPGAQEEAKPEQAAAKPPEAQPSKAPAQAAAERLKHSRNGLRWVRSIQTRRIRIG